MKRLELFDWIAEYVDDNNIQNGEEILLELDGRDICRAVPVIDEDGSIEFKVKALRQKVDFNIK